MKKLTSTPTLADIQQAHLEIQPYINKTAVVHRGCARQYSVYFATAEKLKHCVRGLCPELKPYIYIGL